MRAVAEPSGAPGTATDRSAEARRRLEPIRAAYPFQPRFHDAGGALQHYVDEGPRDGEPLLFLHGNPTWSFAWRHAVSALSDRYRCVAPDHVGCGLSDKPAGYAYRLEQHVHNVERLVLALDLRRLTLVLHDWGGAIGMGFARRHPERVQRLVLLNTAAFRSARMPLRIALCRVPLLGALAVRGLNGFARAATHMAVERPLSEEARRGYLLPYDAWSSRVATLAFVQDIPMRPGHPSWEELGRTEDALPSFASRPTLLLWGERDWCFTPHFRRRWQALLPDAEVHALPDAGHYVFEDAADEVVRSIAGFLERRPLPAAP